MFYNKELLEKYNLEIPTTWDDLLAACKTVVDGEKAEGNDIMGFGPDSVDVVGIVVLEQLGLHYIDGNHTAADWTNEKFANWLRWWKEAEDAGYFQLVDSEGYHSGPFGNQKYFCYMGSSAGMGYITPNGFTIVTGPVPQMADGKQYTVPVQAAMDAVRMMLQMQVQLNSLSSSLRQRTTYHSARSTAHQLHTRMLRNLQFTRTTSTTVSLTRLWQACYHMPAHVHLYQVKAELRKL